MSNCKKKKTEKIFATKIDNHLSGQENENFNFNNFSETSSSKMPELD